MCSRYSFPYIFPLLPPQTINEKIHVSTLIQNLPRILASSPPAPRLIKSVLGRPDGRIMVPRALPASI
jgi:hypothetical protein